MRTFLVMALVATMAVVAHGKPENISNLCTPLDANDDPVPWPWAPTLLTGRKLLHSFDLESATNIDNDIDADLSSAHRALRTVTMYWRLWRTAGKTGKCIKTNTLPPEYVAAVQTNNTYEKVSPGGACKDANAEINKLSAAIIKKFKKQCAGGTIKDISLTRICVYNYGSRSEWTIVGTLKCGGNKTINVYAQDYSLDPKPTVGLWV